MNNSETIYLDHNATTAVDPSILEKIEAWASSWGNPSSVHLAGRKPKQLLRQARKQISTVLNVRPLELVFTSGGSEANNMAIHSVFTEEVLKKQNKEAEFITSNIEHPSVAKMFDWIESLGCKVHRVPVNKDGQFDFNFYKSVLNKNTVLVSLMFANNETGVFLPIKEVTTLAHEFEALVHCDGVQALGKVEINLKELGVDFCSFSAHKVYSLKGAGLLYTRTGTPLNGFVLGGAQERSRRAGTENTLAIASFGHALSLIEDVNLKAERCRSLRDKMETRVLGIIEDCFVISEQAQRLPNTSNIVFGGVDGESLLMNLDLKGIYVSTGAACSSGSSEPSPVLMAMGLTRLQAQGSLRISLGWHTTEEQIVSFVDELKLIVERLRRLKQESES